MRCLFFLFFLISSIFILNSKQLPTAIPPIENKHKNSYFARYDSLTNIDEVNLANILQEELYFIPNVKPKSILDMRKTLDAFLISKKDTSIVYKPKFTLGAYSVTDYNLLQGHTFAIVGVYADPRGYMDDIVCLRDKEDGDSAFVSFEQLQRCRSLIILGFYEKLRAKYIGRKFKPVLSGVAKINNPEIKSNSIMRCIDVSFYEGDGIVGAVVLQDSIGDKFFSCFRLNDIQDTPLGLIDWDVVEANEAKIEKEKQNREIELIKKYGSIIGKKIANGIVKIGFSKEMCRDAWGEPEDVNRTIFKNGVSEQWVYPDGYLYFKNDRLISIQD